MAVAMSGGARDEAAGLLEELLRHQSDGDAERVATAAADFAGASPTEEQLQAAATAISEALHRARDVNDKAAQGFYLVASSRVDLAREADEPAQRSAEEALELFRALGRAKGVAAALEAAFHVQAARQNPNAGLRTANQELQARVRSGDKPGEAAILEMIAHAHAGIGEPQSAINAATQAVEAHRALGDKEAEGSALHLIAEMRWALGEHAQAMEFARRALAVFTAAKCSWGQDKARGTIGSLFAASGHIEKAPNRQEALKALKDLARAVEKKDIEECKSAEDRLNKLRDLVTDYEVVEHLSGILEKDPTATAFLKELGWNFGDGEALDGTYIKQFNQQAFYLFQMMNGMGFGPQFRGVHPYRLGRKPEDYLALEVAQLPETEAWQMDMGFRPGLMDSALQSTAVWGFP
mmetsp:Transcript_79421/g.230593  ORF Transcript_79421/g.230593 Transcript_79421/m.230593 type:complete len:409 (-) Transcript_79421:47-1273(-)